MIAVIDYGVGNLFSIKSSFARVGADVVITSDKNVIRNADKIMLPGVGAYEVAANRLRETGMADLLREEAAKGKYLMGICLGMQLLFEKSYEYGEHEGLGILKGEIVPMKGYVDKHLKVPHIGWNALHLHRDSKLLRYYKEGDFVYFVHSYFATNCKDSVIATTEYSRPITAAVEKDNVMGCQFHPEKSGEVGLSILRAFCEYREEV